MDRIKNYIEEVFSKYEETAESRDLKEEILQNCRDRYNECLAKGMSEEKAEQKVIDSIGNLDSLLASIAKEEGGSSLRSVLAQRAVKAEQSSGDSTSSPYSSEVHHLEINVGSRDVSLIGTDEDELVVDCDNTVRQQVIGDKLVIDENTKRHGGFAGFMGILEDLQDLVVYVPRGFSSIDVKTMSGDVRLENLDAEALKFHTFSGDVDGDLKYCGTLNIDTTSGDADLLGTVENVSASAVSGDFSLDLSGMKKASFHTTSGNLDLTLHDPFDRLDIATVSGDADLNVGDLDGVDLVSSASVSGDVEVNVDTVHGRNPIRISTVSGDVTIDG